jgi:hypothetical protein
MLSRIATINIDIDIVIAPLISKFLRPNLSIKIIVGIVATAFTHPYIPVTKNEFCKWVNFIRTSLASSSFSQDFLASSPTQVPSGHHFVAPSLSPLPSGQDFMDSTLTLDFPEFLDFLFSGWWLDLAEETHHVVVFIVVIEI